MRSKAANRRARTRGWRAKALRKTRVAGAPAGGWRSKALTKTRAWVCTVELLALGYLGPRCMADDATQVKPRESPYPNDDTARRCLGMPWAIHTMT